MKKVAILLAALAASSVVSASVGFAETPTCVMMKFTDDTRFDKVDSAGMLSDLVMEKLVNTGKLNFRGTKVINQDIEKMLYVLRDEDITIFREPDLDNKLTAFAVYGTPNVMKKVKHLKLLQ